MSSVLSSSAHMAHSAGCLLAALWPDKHGLWTPCLALLQDQRGSTCSKERSSEAGTTPRSTTPNAGGSPCVSSCCQEHGQCWSGWGQGRARGCSTPSTGVEITVRRSLITDCCSTGAWLKALELRPPPTWSWPGFYFCVLCGIPLKQLFSFSV